MPTLPPLRQRELERLILKFEIDADAARLDWALLDLALTHSSASPTENYEQLEFVGDAVVRLAAARFLWENHADRPVGEFAAIRSILVSDRVLAAIAESYSLQRYLRLGSNARNDRAGTASRLADAMEATIAALYLPTSDLGFVRSWLDRQFAPRADAILNDPARQNYKAALQEWTQGNLKCLPTYTTEEVSIEHGSNERFAARVAVNGREWGAGTGRSRKLAEQAAARAAFDRHCQN
ncbi:MAG: ribonuclease III [Geitlerinemataceae cyanobacterium]